MSTTGSSVALCNIACCQTKIGSTEHLKTKMLTNDDADVIKQISKDVLNCATNIDEIQVETISRFVSMVCCGETETFVSSISLWIAEKELAKQGTNFPCNVVYDPGHRYDNSFLGRYLLIGDFIHLQELIMQCGFNDIDWEFSTITGI